MERPSNWNDAEWDRWIARTVAGAPPLTDDQRARLARLLSPHVPDGPPSGGGPPLSRIRDRG